MRRVYFHYSDREEFAKNGMWRIPAAAERDAYILASAALMKDTAAFYAAMIRAVEQWPRSCEANLTAPSINHQAWCGHAGCFLATGSPEETTRLGWHTLSLAEQDTANAAADRVITEWRRRYVAAPAANQLAFGGFNA